MTRPTIAAKDLVGELARDRGGWICIDCRFDLGDTAAGLRGFSEATIPGAIYADLERDLSGPVVRGQTGRHPLPSMADFQDTLRRWGVSGTEQVCVFDEQKGSIAARLWWMLRVVGHEHVRLLVGGTKAFAAAGGTPAPGRANERAKSEFVVRPRLDWIASADDVSAIVRAGDGVIVDARAPERFSGDVEPIDSEGGHIPTAQNLPWAENMSGDSLAARESLRERFAALAGKDVVVYCGSGVTACHDIVAMVEAGLPMPRLYVGSWSDWITDPARPRAKGA
jgi:thiosulfate/3-mercaptopyruvate sulfurtransferase